MHHILSTRFRHDLASRHLAREVPIDTVRLPEDELAHRHAMEWWYFIAYVRTSSGRRATVLCSAIRRTLLIDVTNCILKITDHEHGAWPFLECARPFCPTYTEARNPVEFRLDYISRRLDRITCVDGGWEILGDPDRYVLAGHARLSGLGRKEFNLTFLPTAPAESLRGNGVMDYGDGFKLAYYVRPKIRVTGLLQLDDKLEEVTGTGWYERQWGAWPGESFGWKYLNIHLDDGEQWLAFESYRDGRRMWYAARFPAAGGIEEYDLEEHQFRHVPIGGRPLGTLISLSVGGAAVQISVTPLFPRDPSLDSRYPLVPTIWEGVSSVECRWPDRTVKGVAITEIKPHEQA